MIFGIQHSSNASAMPKREGIFFVPSLVHHTTNYNYLGLAIFFLYFIFRPSVIIVSIIMPTFTPII